MNSEGVMTVSGGGQEGPLEKVNLSWVLIDEYNFERKVGRTF